MKCQPIRDKILSRRGCDVTFRSPKDVRTAGGKKHRKGIIIDEVWEPGIDEINAGSVHMGRWGAYAFFSQLIRWDDGKYQIRLGYYRRAVGKRRWIFASQTTICSNWRTIKSLLDNTLAKASWFRDAQK